MIVLGKETVELFDTVEVGTVIILEECQYLTAYGCVPRIQGFNVNGSDARRRSAVVAARLSCAFFRWWLCCCRGLETDPSRIAFREKAPSNPYAFEIRKEWNEIEPTEKTGRRGG